MSIISEKLEDIRNYLDVEVHPIVSPDRWDVYAALCDMVDDLYEMLEEQESRVMTIDEVGTWVMIDRVDRAPIVVEVRDRFITWIVGDEYFDLPECDLSSEFYGKTWRCWNAKPSREDMEAEPWNR